MRRFGHSSANVPAIGQGTWQMEGDDRASAIASLKLGIELGLTHVDTAEMYGSGRVEEIVADAIEGQRERLFLVSKVLPDNASRKGTLRACETSLKRLRTDYLDCYLLHWPGRHALSETIAAFEELCSAGKIRSWGVSNFDETELAQALSIAGPGRISCNQVLYHLGERSIEHAVLPWCEANSVTLVGYTPFGRAKFPPSGSGGDALARIAKAHGKSVRQVALAFLTRKPNLFAIPKASKPEHVRDNAGALGFELSPEEIAAIDAGFPMPKRRPGVPML
ncbi:MAG: aldo/keto reductase [Myxococcota bacterium]|nr:aldo/keto reductase [Myxococcota bacterium]